MENIIEQKNNKSQQFRAALKVSKPEEEEGEEETLQITNKKLQNVYARKDAELAKDKRKLAYLKAMNRIEELSDEDETEIQAFFDDIQRKTDEYLRNQDEEERIKQNKKYGEKYNIQLKGQEKSKKNMKKENRGKKVSGTSMKEILNSQEFKKMWEESQEER